MNQGAFNQIAGELAKAGLSLEAERIITHLENRRITPEKELQKMEFLFKLFHKPCFPRGELVAFSGKAKSGKTFVSSILMTLCFRSEVLSVERIGTERLRVLWYDTEQSEESTQDILRHRIIPMSGMEEQDFPMQLFDIFNVRADMYDDRLPMLETAVNHYHPDLVILDGIRDLIADINDGVVAQNCIERLMKLASSNRCCIVCILHQNKAAEDRNLRGWIGTELKNKAFEVYECNKSERIFSWSQTDTRKYDILDKLQFSVDENGIPHLCTQEELTEAIYKAQQNIVGEQQLNPGKSKLAPFNPKYVLGKKWNKTVFDLPRLFADCMIAEKTYTEDELQRSIGMVANIVMPNILWEQVDKAISQGIIVKNTSPSGKSCFVRPIRQSEIQFNNNSN